MSNVVVTELVVDARGAEQGTAAYDRAMKVAQSAIDRMLDRDNAMRNAMEQTSIAMQTAGGTVTGAAKSWERLRAAADPTVTMMKKIQQATLDADAAVRRGITTQAEADRVLEQYVQTVQASSSAGREAAREAQALAAAQEKAAQAAARSAAALDDLRASHDATYDATRRMAREVDELATLESAGIQIAGGYAAALDRIIQKYDESAREAQAAAAAQENATQAASRQAAILDDLRASYDPVHDAQRRMARELDELASLESAGIQIAGGYAAALDRIVLKYDAAAQAALKAKNAQAEMIRQAREDQASANTKTSADANQGAFSSFMGVRPSSGNAARDSAQVFEDEARAVAKLREEINPLGAAYDRLMERIQTYEAMARRGSITTDELSRATNLAQGEFDKLARNLPEVEGQAKLTGSQVQNLGYQVNDVVTMLLSGSSPFQVMATQSGQVVQALSDGPKGVRGSLEAIKQSALDMAASTATTLGPAGLIVLGLTAAAGAAILFGTSAEDRLEKVNKAAEAFGKTLADIRRSNSALADSIDSISEKGLKLSSADLTNKIKGDIETQRKAIEEARQGAAQASLSTGGWNPFNGLSDAYNAITGSNSTITLAGLTDGFLRGTKDAKTLRSELLALKATGDLPGYLKEPIDQVIEFAEKAIKAQGGIEGLTRGLEELRAKAAQLRFDDASTALAGLTPDVSEVEKVERAYRETMGRIAQLRGSDKQVDRDGLREAAGLQRAQALKELSRDAVRAAGEAQNRLENLSLNPDQRSIAEIRQRYDAEISDLARLNGSEDALAAKRRERDAAVSAAQLEVSRADNARRAGYDLDLRAVEARTAAEKAQIAAERERISYLQQGYSESEAAAAGDRARTLSLAEAKGQLNEALRQQGEASARQIEQAQLEYDLVGKSVGETARLRAEFELLAQAKDAARAAGFDESTVTLTAAMKAQAAEIGRLTEATLRLNLARDQEEEFRSLREEATLIGLNDDARRVAMAGIRAEADLRRQGISLNDAWGQSYVSNARQIASMDVALDKQTKQFEGLRDAAKDFFEALGSGEGLVDALASAFGRFGQQLASDGFDKLFGGLFGGGSQSGANSPAGVAQVISAVRQVVSSPSVPVPTPRPGNSSSYPYSDKYALPAATAAATKMTNASSSLADVLRDGANRIGTTARDLATVISFETGGSFSTTIKGGAGGRHLGLIQFGPSEQKRYGVAIGQTLSDQMDAVVGYLKDRGFKPGMDIYDLYSTINAGRPGRYNASDAANGGTWGSVRDKVDHQFASHYAKADSVLNGTARDLTKGVSRGVRDGFQEVARDNWAGLRDVEPSAAPSPGRSGLFSQSGMQVAGAGLGAFFGGYQSGSPFGGLMSGGFGGFQAAESIASAFPALAGVAGPLGIVGGAALGLIGGILGARKQREQQHRQKAEAWEQMRPAYEKFDASLSGDKGDFRTYITDAWGQLSGFMQTGGAAWKYGKGNSTAQFDSTGRKLFEGFLKMLSEFQEGFDFMISDMSSGQGLQGAFAKGRNATKELASQIKKTRDDIDIAFGNIASIDFLNTPDAQRQAQETEKQRTDATARYNDAAAKYALSLLYTAEKVSDVQQTIDGLRGTAAGLVPIFKDLGWNADDAAKAIDERLNQAIAHVARGLEQSVSDRIAELSGKGYTTSVRDFLEEFAQLQKDFAAAGAGSSQLPELFRLEAQAIVDGAELSGDALADLVRQFPSLEGVVKAAGSAVSATTTEIADAVAGYEDRLFEARNAGNELAAFDRKAAKERLDAAKFGADALASLEKTLAAERTVIALSAARSTLDQSYQAETDRINDLLAARRDEANELESTIDKLKSFANGIADFRKGLLVDDGLSTLTPEARVAEARKQFMDLAAKAQAGDEDAQSKMTGAGQEYLTEARSFYASSERYHDAFDEVRRILDQSETAARSQLSTAESQLEALKRQISIDEAQLETNKKEYEALLGINDGIKSLAVAMKEYAAAAAAARQQGVTVPGTAGTGGGKTGDINGGWTAGSASGYLAQNKDVAAAIAAGETFGLPVGMAPEVYASAHFGLYGQTEGRKFSDGGYTGAGGVHDVAGVVHKGEVVWSQRDVASWGGAAVVDTMRVTRAMPTLNMRPAPRAALGSNDNAPVVAGLNRLQASFEARFSLLAKATAQGAVAVKGSVDEGNRLTGRQSAREKRKAMA